MNISELNGTSFAEVVGDATRSSSSTEANWCINMGFRRDVEFVLDLRRGWEDKQQLLLFSAMVPRPLPPVSPGLVHTGRIRNGRLPQGRRPGRADKLEGQ